MKSIIVASSCACVVTSIAWSVSVLILAGPPPAMAEESPRVRELQATVLELRQNMEDMQRKLHGLAEAQVWRSEEPEEPAPTEPVSSPSDQLLVEVQQKNGEMSSLAKRVDGIEEYLRYGSDFQPAEPEPDRIPQSLAAHATVRHWVLDSLGSAGALLTVDGEQLIQSRRDHISGTFVRLLDANTALQAQRIVERIEVLGYREED